MSEWKLEENKAQKDIAVETISTKHKTAKLLIVCSLECIRNALKSDFKDV